MLAVFDGLLLGDVKGRRRRQIEDCALLLRKCKDGRTTN